MSKDTIVKTSSHKPSILEKAEQLVNGPKLEVYGNEKESFTNIANMWSMILKYKVTPTDVAKCMIALKLMRENNKPKEDNRIDICGYAYLLDKLEK